MSPLLYLLGLGHIVGVGKVTIQDNKEERAAGAGMCAYRNRIGRTERGTVVVAAAAAAAEHQFTFIIHRRRLVLGPRLALHSC